jgi:hypothetical protein
MRFGSLLISFFVLAATTQAQAQTPACAAQGPAPAEFTGFDTPGKLAAGLTLAAAPELKPGQAYTVSLSPAPSVTYAKTPDRPPVSDRFAGLTAFTITKAGTYSIAADLGVWFDVLSNDAVIDSTSHHHVDCSSVRKVVDFPLKPGSYTLQLSGSPKPAVVIMIIPAV